VSVTPELALDFMRGYAGGLGVLEGDKFYAAARLNIPYTVITLYYPQGYVTYREEGGELVPAPEENPLDERLVYAGGSELQLGGGRVLASYYAYRQGSATAVFIKVEGPEWAVRAAGRLYLEGSERDRFYKYLILARGAVNYIEQFVGWDSVKYLDLQESYAAFVLLFRRHPRARLVIHTPAPWCFPAFHKKLFSDEFGFDTAMDPVVAAELGLAMSSEGVTVSKKMMRVVCRIFPHHCFKFRAVTNAVEIPRWEHPRVSGVKSADELRAARKEVKREALRALGAGAEGKVVISWARRVTQYKRPHFVAQLIEELKSDAVFILGGRAHPHDKFGLHMMKKFKELARSRSNVYYFPDLTVDTARRVIWASDIWLFTPFSGWEASGTSFMKAGINGVPSVASRDGAAVEAIRDGFNGWLFGDNRDVLLPLDSPEVELREYDDFKRKVEEALDAYSSSRYWEVAYNAYATFREYFSMDRAFREYGYLERYFQSFF